MTTPSLPDTSTPGPVPRRLILTATAASVVGMTVGASPAVAAQPSDTIDAALEWYDISTETVLFHGSRTGLTNQRTWAIAWLAAARALRATPRHAGSRDYQRAALASAVHSALVSLVPSRATELDAALDTTLARIPAGVARDRGVTVGAREALALLAERTDDRLDPDSVDAPFPAPTPAPGVWQPTPPDFIPAVQAGGRYGRPFLLHRGDQFRPPPPPALGSERYRRDLAEVRSYGAVDSTTRVQAQTDVAEFWVQGTLGGFNDALRVALADSSRRSLAWRATLVAVYHVVQVDTRIAASDGKYAYLRWRPVTAIRSADIDGDPATVADPNWMPVHWTPNHPDYPSGHCVAAGALAQVLNSLVGRRPRKPFALTSFSSGATRTYHAWDQIVVENINARVWSGIHSRTADEVGVVLGREVAAYSLRRVERLFR